MSEKPQEPRRSARGPHDASGPARPDADAGSDPGPDADAGRLPVSEPSGALLEPPEEAVARLEGELLRLNDKYLRLAAEYDNFRKRSVKERGELWGKAQADVLGRLVDALDDLARFAHVDPARTEARTIHDGVDMVERKIWKELEALGVTRIDRLGVPFDPHLHEAVTTQPAPEAAADHTVGAVLQPGYQLGGVLIRPARVAVLTWGAGGGRAGGGGEVGGGGEAC